MDVSEVSTVASNLGGLTVPEQPPTRNSQVKCWAGLWTSSARCPRRHGPHPAVPAGPPGGVGLLQGHVVDSGNPLLNGHNVTKDGQLTRLTQTDEPALG